ncbi:hypothetical protein EIP91_006555 [Steccherinum ochraceum]|uniref:MOSC domain-containing protein n=1 Tax=Steccherinum ochraceum TaxID=92696 RepID=A0A4R0RBD7_9APHY|nr:hypothetical protein EIP91_006555 [Steccherinum ochraceum]
MANQYLLLVALLLPVVAILWSKRRTSAVAPPVARVEVKESDIIKPVKPLNRTLVQTDHITVSRLFVFPIKSCRGTELQEARWTPIGFEYDRKWCIVKAEDQRVLTLRQHAEMVHIHPRILPDPTSPYGGVLTVEVPLSTGTKTFSLPLNPTPEMLETWRRCSDVVMFEIFEMDGYVCQSLSQPQEQESPSDILSAFLGRPVLLLMKSAEEERMAPPTEAFPDLVAPVCYPDVYPIHFASEESLESLSSTVNLAAQLGGTELPKEVRGIAGEWVGRKLEMERFRPNIVLKGSGVPYAEDLWREVEIESQSASAPTQTQTKGMSQIITVVDQCARCLLPNVDPSTGIRDPAIPNKVITRYGNANRKKKPIFGTYAVPEGDGYVRVGDRVRVRKWVGVDEEVGM